MSARAEFLPDLGAPDQAARQRADFECPFAPRNEAPVATPALRVPLAWLLADGVLAIGVLATVVIVTSLERMPRGLAGFLAIRLTVKNAGLVTLFACAWPLVLTLCGLYAPQRLRTGRGEWPRLLLAGAVGGVLALVFPLTSRSGAVDPLDVLLFGLGVVPAAWLLRAAVRAMNHAPRRQVLLVGSGPLAVRMYRHLMSDPSHDTTVVGFVDSEPQPGLRQCLDCRGCNAFVSGPAYLGNLADLERVLMHRVVDDVFIGLPLKSRYDDIRQSMAACARVGVPASCSADLFGGDATTAHPDDRGAPVLSLTALPGAGLRALKRAVDIAGALVLLVVLAPVMLGIAIVIKLTSRGAIVFSQDRYGYMKRLFRMYKFRTMVAGAERMQDELEKRNEASGPVFKIRNDPRITPIGRFLRKTSLDELPQLWNVLTGEMSLVGPRPLPTRDVGSSRTRG